MSVHQREHLVRRFAVAKAIHMEEFGSPVVEAEAAAVYEKSFDPPVHVSWRLALEIDEIPSCVLVQCADRIVVLGGISGNLAAIIWQM